MKYPEWLPSSVAGTLRRLVDRVRSTFRIAARRLGQFFCVSRGVLGQLVDKANSGFKIVARCLGRFLPWLGGLLINIPRRVCSGLLWLLVPRKCRLWSLRFLAMVAASLGLFLGLCIRSIVEPKVPIQGFSYKYFLSLELSVAVLLVLVLSYFCAFILLPLRGRSAFAMLYEISSEFQATVDTFKNVADRSHASGELRQIYLTVKHRLPFRTVQLLAVVYLCLVCLVVSAWFLATAYPGWHPVLKGTNCGSNMGMLEHSYFGLVTLTTLAYGDIHPANLYGFILGTSTICIGICIYGAAFVGFVNFWPEALKNMHREIHNQIYNFSKSNIGAAQLLDEV